MKVMLRERGRTCPADICGDRLAETDPSGQGSWSGVVKTSIAMDKLRNTEFREWRREVSVRVCATDEITKGLTVGPREGSLTYMIFPFTESLVITETGKYNIVGSLL